MNQLETIVTRNPNPVQRFALLDEMIVERGTKADWDLLHDLHYKAEKLPVGPRFWRMTLHGRTIGVLVTGAPKGLLRERHQVFPKLKPGANETPLTNTNRYHYVNANFRVISRFVIDTMYRGIGAGYRMMNLVARMEGTPIMEIQSSMSKFNSFGEKAGFKFVKPMNANKYEKVMRFFRKHFDAIPSDYEAIVQSVESKPPHIQAEMLELLKDFYFKNSALENTAGSGARGEVRVAAMSLRDSVKAIQQVGLASPMYGVRRSIDPKGTVPQRLPLTAFHWQGVNEPLRIPEGFVSLEADDGAG